MTILDGIAESLGEEIMTMDGFDDCVVGYVERCGVPTIFVYDEQKIIDKLVERDGMDPDDAVEYYCFNIEGAYMGEGTPGIFTEVSHEKES